MNGIEGVCMLCQVLFEFFIVMLMVYEDDEVVFDVFCVGVIGYLVKGLLLVKLLVVIDEVQVGGLLMSLSIVCWVVCFFQWFFFFNFLLECENEVFKLLCEGDNYFSIVEKFYISGNIVCLYIKFIYKKFEVNLRVVVVFKVSKEGFV